MEINTSRFSLLKLHGSVGFSSIEEYGECNHYHNGLPDWWELKYFGVLTGTDPNADPDHNGVSNMNEYLAGTNPTNAASYFHIVSVTRGSPTKILLTCEPGKFYTLLWVDDIATNWTVVTGQYRIPSSIEGVIELDDATSATNRFYRVRLE